LCSALLSVIIGLHFESVEFYLIWFCRSGSNFSDIMSPFQIHMHIISEFLSLTAFL
jgi:hypothetical protein